MRISYIITTCCGDPEAASQRTPSRRATMGDREALLRDEILPYALAQRIDEIIVAGRFTDSLRSEFEPSGVTFFHVDPVVRWRTEAGNIRQRATEIASGDILIYTPDDHHLALDFAKQVREAADEPWDIWCPNRVHALTGQRLNTGESEGYMSWHGNVVRSRVPDAVPWDFLNPRYDFQDIPFTALWKTAGFRLRWGPPLRIYDVEAEHDED